jgi:obg-like ATPase 1
MFTINSKVAIIGLANSGKTTCYNSLTEENALVDEALFSTRRANYGIAFFDEPRFEWLCQHFDPESAVPSKIRVTDCAAFGSVVGAGIGNEETKTVR